VAAQAKDLAGRYRGEGALNIWTSFFLVVSVVILASPLLLSEDTVKGQGSDAGDSNDTKPDWEDNELEIDLASGRLAREDYNAMTYQKAKLATGTAEGVEGDDGCLPEG
jgi:hypothetical protein